MTYRFDRFVFSREQGLRRDGRPVPLEPQALELLEFLLDNRERVVTKDELVEQIWHGRTTSDAAISTLVRTLRRALGDDRTQQRYVHTHPKRGFKFVAGVERVDGDVASRRWPPWNVPLRPGPTLAVLAVFVALVIGTARLLDGSSDSVMPPRLSLVVLPFENLSGDPDLDYLADAFTEDLITDLSRIRDAFVISRSTSFTYRGKPTDIATVAEELGVRYVLEGSLRVMEDKARINAQLIDGESDSHLWSDRYERDLADLFSIQDNVTGRIASVLRAELRVADDRRQGPKATRDAWDQALRGNVILYNHQSVSDYQEANVLLSGAVELDPGISSAWSGLAFVHYVASLTEIPGVSTPDSSALSLEAALKATAADPMNAEPYWLVGVGYARNGQPGRGMAACETAIELNPNMDCGHVCAGLVNMALGRPEAAVSFFEQALRLNPRFRPFTKQKFLGIAHIASDRPLAAIDPLTRALASAPGDTLAKLALASALAHIGRADEARTALASAVDSAGDDSPTIAGLRRSYSWLGPDFERVLEGLRLIGMAS